MFSAWPHIYGFERLSLCDWPGYTSCVLFLGGCNMRCPTCHNWQLAWEAETLPRITPESIMAYIEARKKWLDGIVITGGEATCAPELPALTSALQQCGLPIKIDSNGLHPEVIELLLREKLVKAFSIDVKGPWNLYPRLSGGTTTPEEAQQSLERVFALAEEFPQSFLFRLTHVPLLNDDDVETAKSYVPKGFSLSIQTFVPPRRTQHAEADTQARRQAGDMVSGTYSQGNSQSPQTQRHQ